MNKICGIYKILNLETENFYIGASVNFEKRRKYHIWKLNSGRHENIHLQNAWNLYGENKFVFELIEECNSDILLDIEQRYLNQCVGQLNCYNISNDSTAPMLNRKHTENTKRLIGNSNSIANKGHIPSSHTLKLLSSNNPKFWQGKSRSENLKLDLSKKCKLSYKPKKNFTKEQVLEIRNNHKKSLKSLAQMAREFEVSSITIFKIVHYKTYRQYP